MIGQMPGGNGVGGGEGPIGSTGPGPGMKLERKNQSLGSLPLRPP